MASCAPVLAPLGTAARPTAPSHSFTSTSIVGLPRLSRISRARIDSIDIPFVLGAWYLVLSNRGSMATVRAIVVPGYAQSVEARTKHHEEEKKGLRRGRGREPL